MTGSARGNAIDSRRNLMETPATAPQNDAQGHDDRPDHEVKRELVSGDEDDYGEPPLKIEVCEGVEYISLLDDDDSALETAEPSGAIRGSDTIILCDDDRRATLAQVLQLGAELNCTGLEFRITRKRWDAFATKVQEAFSVNVPGSVWERFLAYYCASNATDQFVLQFANATPPTDDERKLYRLEASLSSHIESAEYDRCLAMMQSLQRRGFPVRGTDDWCAFCSDITAMFGWTRLVTELLVDWFRYRYWYRGRTASGEMVVLLDTYEDVILRRAAASTAAKPGTRSYGFVKRPAAVIDQRGANGANQSKRKKTNANGGNESKRKKTNSPTIAVSTPVPPTSGTRSRPLTTGVVKSTQGAGQIEKQEPVEIASPSVSSSDGDTLFSSIDDDTMGAFDDDDDFVTADAVAGASEMATGDEASSGLSELVSSTVTLYDSATSVESVDVKPKPVVVKQTRPSNDQKRSVPDSSSAEDVIQSTQEDTRCRTQHTPATVAISHPCGGACHRQPHPAKYHKSITRTITMLNEKIFASRAGRKGSQDVTELAHSTKDVSLVDPSKLKLQPAQSVVAVGVTTSCPPSVERALLLGDRMSTKYKTLLSEEDKGTMWVEPPAYTNSSKGLLPTQCHQPSHEMNAVSTTPFSELWVTKLIQESQAPLLSEIAKLKQQMTELTRIIQR